MLAPPTVGAGRPGQASTPSALDLTWFRPTGEAGRRKGVPVSSNDFDIPLADAISALRAQLTRALEQGADADLRFALGPVELELALILTRQAGAEAGARWWVASAGARAERGKEITHRVRLTLEPVDRRGERIKLRDEAKRIPRAFPKEGE